MKKVIFFTLIGIIVTFFVNKDTDPFSQAKVRETAAINFSEPTPYQSDFIFTSVENELFMIFTSARILPPEIDSTAVTDSIKKPKVTHTKNGTIMKNISTGNAFFVATNGEHVLYSAYHCTDGLKKYTKRAGADIAIIDFKKMLNDGKANCLKHFQYNAHSMASHFSDNDSFFIKGYRLDDKERRVRAVMIKGIGTYALKEDMPKEILEVENGTFTEEKMIIFKMENNIDLAGLSGSPAFNTKNEVVGIFSGSFFIPEKDTAITYGRISLF